MNMFEYLAHEGEQARSLLKDPDYKQRSRLIMVAFATLALVGAGVGCLVAAAQETRTDRSGHLWWKTETTAAVPASTRVTLLIMGILLIGIGVALVLLTIRRRVRQNDLRKYPAILTGVETIEVQHLAAITGHSPSQVFSDIKHLIDSGTLEDFYLDYSQQQVVSKKYVPKLSHKTVVTCSGCGGANELIVGITRPCTFCGQPLILKPR